MYITIFSTCDPTEVFDTTEVLLSGLQFPSDLEEICCFSEELDDLTPLNLIMGDCDVGRKLLPELI